MRAPEKQYGNRLTTRRIASALSGKGVAKQWADEQNWPRGRHYPGRGTGYTTMAHRFRHCAGNSICSVNSRTRGRIQNQESPLGSCDPSYYGQLQGRKLDAQRKRDWAKFRSVAARFCVPMDSRAKEANEFSGRMSLKLEKLKKSSRRLLAPPHFSGVSPVQLH